MIEATISCDHCGTGYGTTWVSSDPEWMRDVTRSNGWGGDDLDLCPTCLTLPTAQVHANIVGGPF